MQPEDYWSPAIDVPEGQAFIEEYGKMSPLPAHDGTDCFKWDNTLWGSEGHFKVSPRRNRLDGRNGRGGGGKRRRMGGGGRGDVPLAPTLMAEETQVQGGTGVGPRPATCSF
jgi:hypothetical protein